MKQAMENIPKTLPGRVRDVRQGPDGYIYVAIDGNERGDKTPIYRLEPADESRTSEFTQ